MTGYEERRADEYTTRTSEEDRDGRYLGLTANHDAIIRLAQEFMTNATALHSESNTEEQADIQALRTSLVAQAGAILTLP